MTIKEEVCPRCGAPLGEHTYEKEGVRYCCEPCATGGTCECESEGKHTGERHPG